jgi:hypothetical protein
MLIGCVLREGLQMMTGLFWDLGEQGVPGSAFDKLS